MAAPLVTELDKKELRDRQRAIILSLDNLMDPTLPHSVPALLDTVQNVVKEKSFYPQLSDFYPQKLTENDGNKLYEVAYCLKSDGIYQVLFDPSSDTVDSGESRMQKVSKEEFFSWVQKDQRYVLDVYNRLVSYLDLSPQ